MFPLTLVSLAPKSWNHRRASTHLDGLQNFGAFVLEAIFFKEFTDGVNSSFDLVQEIFIGLEEVFDELVQ